MAVSTTDTYSGPYAANGVTVAFPFTFKAVSAADVAVIFRASDGSETVADDGLFTVALASEGGTVTFSTAPLALVGDVFVVSEPAFIQSVEFASGQPFLPSVVNEVNDRDVVRALYLKGKIDRAPQTPIGGGAEGQFPTVLPDGSWGFSSGTGNDPAFRADAASTAPDKGAALVGFKQPLSGAVVRTAYDKFLETVSVKDFATLGDAWAAAGFKPLIDPTTGALFLTADSAPLNYSGSRARFVYQHRDTAAGATNELIPGAVFQFNATGNGTVNAGTELSQTIWQGQFNYMSKTGDGSAHTFTAIGELKAVGPGGYNELGLFQGEGTNIASALGTMSGVEMLLKDSPDAGATTFSTKMQAVVGRIAKYNPTVRKSHNFYASCEGTQAIDAILGGNPGGLASWLRGFDFQGLTFTTGQFGLAPNNTYLAWLRAGGVAAPIIGLNDVDDVFIVASTPTNRVNIGTSALATRLAVDQDASNAVLIWVNGSLKRVTEGAADSAGSGFKQLKVEN